MTARCAELQFRYTDSASSSSASSICTAVLVVPLILIDTEDAYFQRCHRAVPGWCHDAQRSRLEFRVRQSTTLIDTLTYCHAVVARLDIAHSCKPKLRYGGPMGQYVYYGVYETAYDGWVSSNQ